MKTEKATFILGSTAELARVCGVSRQTANEWSVVPHKHLDTVKKAIRGRVNKVNRVAEQIL